MKLAKVVLGIAIFIVLTPFLGLPRGMKDAVIVFGAIAIGGIAGWQIIKDRRDASSPPFGI